jgi:hypothetical protein
MWMYWLPNKKCATKQSVSCAACMRRVCSVSHEGKRIELATFTSRAVDHIFPRSRPPFPYYSIYSYATPLRTGFPHLRIGKAPLREHLSSRPGVPLQEHKRKMAFFGLTALGPQSTFRAARPDAYDVTLFDLSGASPCLQPDSDCVPITFATHEPPVERSSFCPPFSSAQSSPPHLMTWIRRRRARCPLIRYVCHAAAADNDASALHLALAKSLRASMRFLNPCRPPVPSPARRSRR